MGKKKKKQNFKLQIEDCKMQIAESLSPLGRG
jgi:hypothetical protein